MKRAILSSDNNPDYLSLIPITCFSWARLGYAPMVHLVGVAADMQRVLEKYSTAATFYPVIPIEGMRNSTTAQVLRLLPEETWNPDDIMITGDADMLICKDIFGTEGELVSYGYDLTGRSELPICYVKATVAKWREFMKVTGGMTMQEFLGNELWNRAKSDQWESYWSVDQQLLTQRAREYGMDKITFVDRGFSGPISANRWDRYSWHIKPADIIDVHVIRSPLANWDKITGMCTQLWPEDNWAWLADFKEEFEKVI
jgi:hypothetical protein